MVVDFGQRQDFGQHKSDHHQPKCNGQIYQPRAGGGNRSGEHTDGQPDLFVIGHRQSAFSQWQAAQPFGDFGATILWHQQQQDVARVHLGFAHLFGNALAVSRNSHQDGALPPAQTNGLRRFAFDAGIFGDHNLDDLQAIAIGVQQFLPLVLGEIQRKRRAKFIQRVGRGFQHQSVTSQQFGGMGGAVAPLAIAHQSKDGDIVFIGGLIQLAHPFSDVF